MSIQPYPDHHTQVSTLRQEDSPGKMQRCSSKSCLKKLDPITAATASSCSSSPLRVPASTPLPKNVSFHKIEISQYPIEIGDNPCAEGVPIQIGWQADRTDVFDFEDYETTKPSSRPKAEMHMPPSLRQALLFSQGESANDMASAVQEARKIQKSRYRSILNRKWDGFHYRWETTRRRLRKVASLSALSPTVSSSTVSPTTTTTTVATLSASRSLHCMVPPGASTLPRSRSYSDSAAVAPQLAESSSVVATNTVSPPADHGLTPSPPVDKADEQEEEEEGSGPLSF